MKIKLENITVNYSLLTDFDEYYIGKFISYIPSEIIIDFLEGYDFNINKDDDFEDLPNYNDDINNWLEENRESENYPEDFEDYHNWNADFQILIFNHINKYYDYAELKYSSNHIYWLFHDFMHSKKDVYGDVIEVNKYAEEQRTYDTFELMIKNGYKNYIDGYVIEKIYKAVYDSWAHKIDIGKIYRMLEKGE